MIGKRKPGDGRNIRMIVFGGIHGLPVNGCLSSLRPRCLDAIFTDTVPRAEQLDQILGCRTARRDLWAKSALSDPTGAPNPVSSWLVLLRLEITSPLNHGANRCSLRSCGHGREARGSSIDLSYADASVRRAGQGFRSCELRLEGNGDDMSNPYKGRAFTLIETISVMISLVVLILSTLPPLSRARQEAKLRKDSSQQHQIHAAMVIFSRDTQGRLPTPGLIDRLPDPDLGQRPGFGPEDGSKNHTAPLFSSLIAREFFPPELVVSSIEINPFVRVAEDYDYGSYDPANDSYWDSSFSARFDDDDVGSNVSYAHAAICGDRKETRWRATTGPNYPVLGNRGTKGGVEEGFDYLASPTRMFGGDRLTWKGATVFADGHVEVLASFFAPNVTFAPRGGEQIGRPDNIYAAEFEHEAGNQAAADAFLCISKSSTLTTVDDVYDRTVTICCADHENPTHCAHNEEQRKEHERKHGCKRWRLRG